MLAGHKHRVVSRISTSPQCDSGAATKTDERVSLRRTSSLGLDKVTCPDASSLLDGDDEEHPGHLGQDSDEGDSPAAVRVRDKDESALARLRRRAKISSSAPIVRDHLKRKPSNDAAGRASLASSRTQFVISRPEEVSEVTQVLQGSVV